MKLLKRLFLPGRYTETQYRARCTCGWTSRWFESDYESDEAWVAHKRTFHR